MQYLLHSDLESVCINSKCEAWIYKQLGYFQIAYMLPTWRCHMSYDKRNVTNLVTWFIDCYCCQIMNSNGLLTENKLVIL